MEGRSAGVDAAEFLDRGRRAHIRGIEDAGGRGCGGDVEGVCCYGKQTDLSHLSMFSLACWTRVSNTRSKLP